MHLAKAVVLWNEVKFTSDNSGAQFDITLDSDPGAP